MMLFLITLLVAVNARKFTSVLVTVIATETLMVLTVNNHLLTAEGVLFSAAFNFIVGASAFYYFKRKQKNMSADEYRKKRWNWNWSIGFILAAAVTLVTIGIYLAEKESSALEFSKKSSLK